MNEPTIDLPVATELPVAIVPAENPSAMIRHATDVAGVCREIVMRTACNIQGRKYVKYEGWMAIATAHGCIASSRDVRKVEGGWVAIGEIRRMSDGVLLAQAEGFVGLDEKKWGNCPEYASRAMAQTRAISRVCRAAFAHVVVLIDGGLSTTPAEEIPDGGFRDEPPKTPQDAPASRKASMPAQPAKTSPTPKSATAAPAPAKTGKAAKADEKAWDSFLAACKARLLAMIDQEIEWAWWRYGCDRAWILPTESLSDARADKMFQGMDRANPKDSVKAIFEKHKTAVDAMAAATPPEMREEIMRGMTILPKREPDTKPPAAPKGICCPTCQGTAIKKHDDLVGASFCQKCGTMWLDSNPAEAHEEHEWMWAKLPFAPKDAAKKFYKGLTLGQISRLDSRYWFGVISNYKAEPYQGRPPSHESVEFADACEDAREHLQRNKDDNDDVPM